MKPLLENAITTLAPFADPHAGGRHMSVDETSADTVAVRMVCRGDELKFSLELAADHVRVRRGRQLTTLREFLAGPDLADLVGS